MVLEVQLNDKLAQEAKANGLLDSLAIENMLRSELKRRRAEKFFEAAERVAATATNSPPMSDAEIEAEIKAVRARKRDSDASGR